MQSAESAQILKLGPHIEFVNGALYEIKFLKEIISKLRQQT